MYGLLETILLLIVAFCLTKLPIIGAFLSLFHTLIHENGHAIAAKLTGGKIHAIELYSNTEGVALTSHKDRLGSFFTVAAGYIFASVISVLYVYALFNEWYIGLLITISVIVAYNALFLLRNFIGFFWAILVLMLLASLYTYGSPLWINVFLYILGAIILIQALASSYIIFNRSYRMKHDAGDATSLRKATFIPTTFWGFGFLIQGVFFFLLGSVRLLQTNIPFLQ